MSKGLKIFLAVLALIVISFSLLYYFNLIPFFKKGVETIKNNNGAAQTATEDRSIALPDQINTSGDCVVLDKENCSLGKAIYENNQLTAVGFNIPKDGGVYAPFKGQIEKNSTVLLNGIGYPAIELMDITKDDWGRQEIRTYFYVVVSNFQSQTIPETLERGQTIIVINETSKVQEDYNLILTFRKYDIKANQGETNLDLLKQFFPDLGK